jgi:hypothetical protein
MAGDEPLGKSDHVGARRACFPYQPASLLYAGVAIEKRRRGLHGGKFDPLEYVTHGLSALQTVKRYARQHSQAKCSREKDHLPVDSHQIVIGVDPA